MKTIAALAITTLTIGCIQAPEPATRASGNDVPNPLVIVGAAAPGLIAANDLRADGLTVVTAFNGRAAGLTAFCSGQADALALTNGLDLTSAERDRCRALKEGWGWSALSTEKGIGFYVRHEFAENLLAMATTTFR